MRGFLTRLLVSALGLWAADLIIPGIGFAGWQSLLVAALLLGLVNAFVRPLILILTLPITVLTLGLFLLVVNGLSLAIVAWLVPGFTISSLFAATLGALLVSGVSWVASSFVGDSGRFERMRRIEVTGRRID